MKLPSMKRPSPSMAVSILALVVAAGGTSYAAATIGTSDIQQQAVTSGKIKNNTIRSVDVKNGSLKSKDLRDQTRWLLVNSAGAIVAQSGGFEVEAAYPTLGNTAPVGAPDNSLRANGNVYIDAGEILSNNGITATIALQNQLDQDGGGMGGRTAGADANAEFSGEISVSQCGLTAGTPSSMTACAPLGTNTNDYFVVSPRNSDGSVTTPDTRKRFYVIITGNSSDVVAP
ncbi:MAG: hypothetical protein WKF79_03225 [Nocardioides sp.]